MCRNRMFGFRLMIGKLKKELLLMVGLLSLGCIQPIIAENLEHVTIAEVGISHPGYPLKGVVGDVKRGGGSGVCNSPEIVKLTNPISVSFLKKKLRKSSPRLILNSSIERQLKRKVKTDPVVQNMYKAIRLNAGEILKHPLLERKLIGRRLLSVSREMLYRMNILCMVHRIDHDSIILNRINDELVSVCNFSDWNPSHYLDVAEMALAVSIAVDWAGDALPASTIEMAKKNLLEKGIMPSFKRKESMWWINGSNNWNQVCHGGMIAAAITVANEEPELAAKTIRRALDGMPNALKAYGPDGVYPEGSTYWYYGTTYTVLAASMLESAFGTDFGVGDYPAFRESAIFRALCNAPSGWYFNFADCGDVRSENGDMTLAWFAAKTGNREFFEKERFLHQPGNMGKLTRHAGAGLIWLSQFEEKGEVALPKAWKGDGVNPVVIFSDGKAGRYYFGGKGGCGSLSHGNMDGGSFVFELDGVRWVVDPGNQNYNDLEKTGFNLWGFCQECERLTLLTKNNFGHSTLTVNNQLHVVNGRTFITDFKDGAHPEVTFDLSAAFQNQMKSAHRRFVKDGPTSLMIEDHFELSKQTKNITWQLMTLADVEIVPGGAILKQAGKQLKLEILSHPDLTFSVISLCPAPLSLDRQIKGLKRIEIRMPAWMFGHCKGMLKVRISGMEISN